MEVSANNFFMNTCRFGLRWYADTNKLRIDVPWRVRGVWCTRQVFVRF